MKYSCPLFSPAITSKHAEYLARYNSILCHKSWIMFAGPLMNSVSNDKCKAKFGFQLHRCKSIIALKSTEYLL